MPVVGQPLKHKGDTVGNKECNLAEVNSLMAISRIVNDLVHFFRLSTNSFHSTFVKSSEQSDSHLVI